VDAALLVARLLLVVVFGVAGLAKLADRAGSRQALVDFGVPPPPAAPPRPPLPPPALAGPSAVGWLGSLTAMQYLLLAAAVIGLGLVVAVVWCLVQLMAQNGRLLL